MMVVRILIAVTALLVFSGCGEKPQTSSGTKLDAVPYSGTGMAYVEKNWKVGDKSSWESALRARAQSGQNDYSRSN